MEALYRWKFFWKGCSVRHLRNERGELVQAFSAPIGQVDSNQVEIVALRGGVRVFIEA